MKKKPTLLSRLLSRRKKPVAAPAAVKMKKKKTEKTEKIQRTQKTKKTETQKIQKTQETQKAEKKKIKKTTVPKAKPVRAHSSTRALSNPKLEDELNLIGAAPIDIGKHKLSFQARTMEGERETLIKVNDTLLRVQIAGRSAGQMLTTVLTEQGELKLRGRLFGITDIEAWLTDEELKRICTETNGCTGPMTVQITYYDRPPSATDRTPSAVDARFLPLC